MNVILGLALFVAVFVFLILAVKLYVLIDSVTVLKMQIQQRAAEQFQAWKESECEGIKLQEKGIATREATVQLENWKATCEDSIRTDAVRRSQSVIVGNVTQHIVPFLPEFRYNPKDARFIGSPVDLLVFDGLDRELLTDIVFIEVKTGSSTLSKRERQIRDVIRAHRIRWEELRVDRSDTPEPVALLPA
jgi:predicted Holliday junction resolvase-like endonuclease